MNRDGRRGTVLVVGGGITGITAAIEAAEVGLDAVLVEREACLGGWVSHWHQYFPKLCPPQCGLEISLRRLKAQPRIRCMTLSDVASVRGEPGNYQVAIQQRPRGVNERCTACGACVTACPVERRDHFNLGMGVTKAIYLPHAAAFPLQFVIDDAACPGNECAKCVPACPVEAIELGRQPERLEVTVDAVIWATGWAPFDASKIAGLGFGTYPNVITNVMMERLASCDGPTGGRILRPSDQQPIRSVAFVQCAGSRDENYLRHCSGVCCLASLKQARYVRAQYPDAVISVFYIDLRAPGRFEDFAAASREDPNLHLIRGKVGVIREAAASRALEVEAEDTLSGVRVRQEADLVVLATGMVPADVHGIGVQGGLRTDEHGFLTDEQGQEGLMAAGCAKRPADVATCVRDATGAVARALSCCTE